MYIMLINLLWGMMIMNIHITIFLKYYNNSKYKYIILHLLTKIFLFQLSSDESILSSSDPESNSFF